jgi:hypothetical protein
MMSTCRCLYPVKRRLYAVYLPMPVSFKDGGCMLSTCRCLYPVKKAEVCCLPAAACVL